MNTSLLNCQITPGSLRFILFGSATSLVAATVGLILEAADPGDFDPFAASPIEWFNAAKERFTTTRGHRAFSTTSSFPPLLDERTWPTLDLPPDFQGDYSTPASVWEYDEGYFASFRGDDLAGGFFYAPSGAKSWRLLIPTPIREIDTIGTLGSGGSVSPLMLVAASGGDESSKLVDVVYYLEREDTDSQWTARAVIRAKGMALRRYGRLAKPSWEETYNRAVFSVGDPETKRLPLMSVGVGPQGVLELLGYRLSSE